MITTIFKLFQKAKDKRKIPNSLDEARITLTPKQNKDTTKRKKKKKTYRPISLLNIDAKNKQKKKIPRILAN